MRVAVIDIGSNTARLLVAERGWDEVAPVHEERALLVLGEEIERFGRLSELKLAETAERARQYARTARELGCSSIELIVTAPGRQSENADALVAALERATCVPARVLTPEDEGRLAFEGALTRSRRREGSIAVVDVGGGSTEIVVGTGSGGPAVCSSVELGSLRLARRHLEGDPPGRKAVARARREVVRQLGGIDLPRVETALATGGSARALRRLAGCRRVGEGDLAHAVRIASGKTSVELCRELGLDQIRARTLLAGTLILAEAQRRLAVPLEVARGGLREGAAFAQLSELAAA
jgi:exopolyphosphatase / guanosine-5'-triphosphate,3'-diphosphate pyrophosphatase